ncbi:MAG: hypothetical protein HY378_01370 [Candidatus Brennerbacteria bacterium]|nr:hypothetical protein [Candidatus Brennerbacteria bacterium]
MSVNNVTANLGVFFAFVVVFERFTVEAYKLFIREEDQRKYFIPQQLHFLGNLINNKPARYLVGLFIVSLVLVSFYVPLIFPVNFQSILFVGLFWGAIGGLANSIGGALKDAPLEGFAPLKFWRSTVMAGLWGAIFSFFTSHPSLLLLASVGAERMTIEFYKTFIEGRAHSKLRAARDSKILFPDWDKKKIRFLILYLLTWVVFLIALL